MDPEELKTELRRDDSRHLGNRRGVSALCVVAIGALGVVTLYQVGILNHLPELPIRGFDSDRIAGSDAAYALFETPDGVLGIGSYAVTLALVSAGGAERAQRRPWLSLALVAKVGFDVFQAGIHSVRQWTRHHALCSWCLAAAGASFAMLPLVIPEAHAGLAQVIVHRNKKPLAHGKCGITPAALLKWKE